MDPQAKTTIPLLEQHSFCKLNAISKSRNWNLVSFHGHDYNYKTLILALKNLLKKNKLIPFHGGTLRGGNHIQPTSYSGVLIAREGTREKSSQIFSITARLWKESMFMTISGWYTVLAVIPTVSISHGKLIYS